MKMTMATRKINNRWHVDLRFDGKRHRKVAPENNKSSAKQYEQELLLQLRVDKKRAKKGVRASKYASYAEYVKEWYETYVQANNRPAEVKKKEGIIRVHILPYFGEMKLAEIQEMELEAFKKLKVEQGYAPKSINNYLAVIRKSLASATEWRLIERTPNVKWLKAPKKDVEVLTKETQRRLLCDTDELLWNTAIVIALKTGMRVGEILALRWQDIDEVKNAIDVNGSMNVNYERAPTKNGKSRKIPMSALVRERVGQLKEVQRSAEYLFDRGDGEPHSKYAAIGAMERTCKRLGITEHVHWHKFRHTFATNHARSGTNIRVLQELLGHSTITMTERYSHVDMASMQEAIQLLDYRIENFGQILGRFPNSQNDQKAKHNQNMAVFSNEIGVELLP